MQNYGLIICLRTSNNSQRSNSLLFSCQYLSPHKNISFAIERIICFNISLHHMLVKPTIIGDNEKYIKRGRGNVETTIRKKIIFI